MKVTLTEQQIKEIVLKSLEREIKETKLWIKDYGEKEDKVILENLKAAFSYYETSYLF